MNRIVSLGLVLLSGVAATPGFAQTTTTTQTTTTATAATATAAKPATLKLAKATTARRSKTAARDTLASEAAAPLADTDAAASSAQLDIASRVYLGRAECEFSQSVNVESLAEKPGYFHVGFKNTVYTMVPEETSTGAVRLEDHKAGVVWIQIGNKSMLMNAKAGQRMVDSCQLDEQRAIAEALKNAPPTLITRQ